MGKKLLFTTVLLSPLIIGGGLVAPSFIDWNAHKAFIETTVKEKTGYDLKLGGDISLSILPSPYLSVKDVSLYNNGVLLSKVEEADASVDLLPLFYGEVNLDTVRFKKPEIFMTLGQNGESNWNTVVPVKDNKKQDASSSNAIVSENSSNIGDSFSLKSVQISDGSFIYDDKKSGQSYVIKGVYTDLNGESLSGPYDLESKLNWQGQDFALTLHSGRISKNEETFPLKFSVSLPKMGAVLNYSGVVVPSFPLDIQGELIVKAKDSNTVFSSVGMSKPYLEDQPFSATSMLTATDEKVSLENLHVSLGPLKWKGMFSSETAQKKTKASLILNNMMTAKFDRAPGFDLLYFLSDLSLKGDASLEGAIVDVNSLVLSKPTQNYIFSGLFNTDEKALLIRDFSAKGLEGKGSISVNGDIDRLQTLDGMDLVLKASFQEFDRFLSSFGFENTFSKEPVKKLSGQVRLTGNKKAVHFNSNLDILDATMKVAGNVKEPFVQKELGDVSLSLSHPNFSAFVSSFVSGFDPGDAFEKPVSLSTKIQQKEGLVNVSDLKGNIGQTTFKADVVTDISSPKIAVSGSVSLGDLVVPVNSTSKKGSVAAKEKESAQKNTTQKKQDGNLRWSRQAIHTGWLHSANLNLDLKAKSITYDLWRLNGFSTKLKMKNGALSLSDLRAGMFDGAIKGDLTLSSGKDTHDPLSVELQADIENILLEKFVSAILKKENEIVKGPVSTSLDIRAVGISTAALVSDLQGKGTLNGKNINIKGVDLNEIAHALRSDVKLKDSFEDLTQIGKGNTRFDSVSGTFSINEGVVQTKDLTFDENRVQMLTTGKVDLPRWMLDLVNTVTFKNNKDAPALDIRINGSLDNPVSTFRDEIIKDFLTRKIERKIQKEFENMLSKKLNEKIIRKENNENTQQVAPTSSSPSSSGKSQKVEPEDVLKSILQDVLR